MSIVESELALLRDPRLAALATSAWPAWLWSADGSRILWANAVGAAIFGAATTAACAPFRFGRADAIAGQIIRLAATLPSGAQERLERMRGFGASFGRALTCACSRIVIANGTSAVLLAAVERAGPALELAERVRRLVGDGAAALAAFAPDGTLLYANPAAQGLLSGAATLSALGIADLAGTAFASGSAAGAARVGDAAFDVAAIRLGKDATRVLLIALAGPRVDAPLAPPPPPQEARQASVQEQQIVQEQEIVQDQATAQEEETAPEATQEIAQATAAETTPEPLETPSVASAPEIPEAVIAPPAVSQNPEPASAPEPDVAPSEPIAERRHPLRFVWHMDADGRFGVGSDEFVELVGPRTMAAFGRLWTEVADELKLDPNNQVARAVASRETWSGIVVSWPVDDSSERLPVELSGLPVFDRDRAFRGYRGFGVCRDIGRINQLARARHDRPLGFMPAPETMLQQGADAASAPPAMTPAVDETAQLAEMMSQRPAASLNPASANVVPFRQSPPAEPKAPPTLSPVERRAFRELAQELTARLREPHQAPAAAETGAEDQPAATVPDTAPAELAPTAEAVLEHVLLDRIPIGILVYRHDSILYANRHFLEWSGYHSLEAIEAAGGLNRLFAEPGSEAIAEPGGPNSSPLKSLSIMTQSGARLSANGRMFSVPWNGTSALVLILINGQEEAARRASEPAPDAAESESRALQSILETTADGVATLDAAGTIVSANSGAGSLFGKTADELIGRSLGELLTPESGRAARDYLDRIAHGRHTLNNMLDVEARAGEDRIVPLAMTLTPIGGDRCYAVFHDKSARNHIEDELREAKREATRTAATKAEFLAKISHEIRTPLNAMTGFAEVIMAERFGAIGNERYREYVRDIHGAGTHLVSMLNDLLDLSRIETGQVDLNFVNVNLNELTQQCVGIMQPQANRARIIIRTSLTPGLPLVIADERSLRQITLNLLSNAIKFTGPGGQVIVSTVLSDAREALLRVRDTGAGMSEKDIQAALEPFAQTATSGSWGSGGTGFGLPLTKALAEANRANFSIKSAPNAGTLVEIAFPPSRIVAN